MSSGSQKDVIKVLIVDDIPDTRENLRKLLAFESDIQVVGAAGSGREAVQMAAEVKPDVVLMDINMPDMDGITATKLISTTVRTAAVVIMSVQSEPGYLRQAMLAGARDFLTKPISSEELYTTIRRVYERNEPIRQQEAQMGAAPVRTAAARVDPTLPVPTLSPQLPGAGHIVVVYSPQGGVGATTLSTNLAAALMRADTRVLLVDCNLQFGDVDAFLNLQAQSNIASLTKAVSDVDQQMIDNVLVTHASGLKVLAAPSHPEQAYDVDPEAVKELVSLLAASYDFVIVDTSTQYDATTLKLFEIADRIVLVCVPTIPAIRNVRKVLDLFDNLTDPAGLTEKVVFVLNQVSNDKGRGTVPAASIETHLKLTVAASIPLDERIVLTSVNQGVPLVANRSLKTRSPGREMVELAELIRHVVEANTTVQAGKLSDVSRGKKK